MKYKVGERVVCLTSSFYTMNNIVEPVGIVDEIADDMFALVYFENKWGEIVARYLFESEMDYAPSMIAWYAHPMNSHENYGVELVKKPGDEHPH